MLVVITNNYGSIHDGIGNYARVVYEQIRKIHTEIRVFSFDTKVTSYFGRLIATGMIKVCETAIDYVKANYYDIEAVVLEYPFSECNPWIIRSFRNLKKVCEDKKIPVVVSLHEYFRTNFVRKYIINKLVQNCDVLFVSNTQTLDFFKPKVNQIYFREIASTFTSNGSNDAKNPCEFCYFGFINKAKAFDELLNAWSRFCNAHKDMPLILNIVTGTAINLKPNKSLRIFLNSDEAQVNSVLGESTYGVLPIIPNVTNSSSTFKAMLYNKCITIACFGESKDDIYKKAGIHIQDNSVESIYQGLEKALVLSKEEKEEKIKYCAIANEGNSPAQAAQEYYRKLRKSIDIYHERN